MKTESQRVREPKGPRVGRTLGLSDLWTLGLFALLPGCGEYVLRGKVIDGPSSRIEFVEPSDPRFGSAGLSDATVELTVDPQSLGRKVLASEPVGPEGVFLIPVKEFGAGLLEYEFELVIQRPGYSSVVEQFRLPGRGKRVLVTLARGTDRYRPREDPLGDTRSFLKD